MENKKTPYGKTTLKEIREAVEYIFREKPVEDAKKRLGDFLDVYEDKGQLSFSIKSVAKDDKGRHMNIRTGIIGFIKTYDMAPWAMHMLPVRLNGHVLDDEHTDVFWETFNEIRKDYEEE